MMPIDILPIAAVILFIVVAFMIALGQAPLKRAVWVFPALLSALFLVFSIIAVLQEGLFGFWAEHTKDLWGNQIWFDLLLAIGIGWSLIVPQAKALGMRVIPWLFLILATGCIGFLAMLSRFLYLRERAASN